MKKIGFIGLGNMGKLMSVCLLRKGYETTVYDIVPAAVEELKAKGAKGAATPAEVGVDADMVFIMVRHFKQAEQVCYGEKGVLQAMRPGSILVINSTVAPSDVRSLGEYASKYGVDVIDAPVSGSMEKAADGSLVLMTACTDEVFERAKDVLYTVGSNMVRVGTQLGMGQTVKAANQLLASVHTVACAEAMVLAQKAGINPEVLHEILSKSVGRSFVFETKAVQLMDRDFATRGALDLNVKDLGICLEMGKELGVPLYVSAIAREVFATAQAKGYGKEDFCAVAKIYEEVAHCEIRRH